MEKPVSNPAVKQLEVAAEPSKIVPKLVTKVGTGRANNNVIISFIFDAPGEKAQLIERVVLDANLANELADLIRSTEEMSNG